MKKLLKIPALLFAIMLIVSSCGKDTKSDARNAKETNKDKDINVSELKTECEVVDAMELVINEMLALSEGVDSEEGASEAQIKEYKALEEKLNDIMNTIKARSFPKFDFDSSKLEVCPNFESLNDNIARIKTIGPIY